MRDGEFDPENHVPRRHGDAEGGAPDGAGTHPPQIECEHEYEYEYDVGFAAMHGLGSEILGSQSPRTGTGLKVPPIPGGIGEWNQAAS